MSADTKCLAWSRHVGACQSCYAGFPQWCIGRGGVPKPKNKSKPRSQPHKENTDGR